MLCSIEMTVVDWNKKIDECLEQTSETSVPVGEFAVPSHEFDFWNQRTKALQDIYEQLVNPEVKKMAIILEENGSVYTSMFRKFFKRVVRGQFKEILYTTIHKNKIIFIIVNHDLRLIFVIKTSLGYFINYNYFWS